MTHWKKLFTSLLAVSMLCVCGAGTFPAPIKAESAGQWNIGYGRRQILPDKNSTQPLYIAGYNSGWEVAGILDYCEARAVWLDVGGEGVLLIGIDCVALDSGTVGRIRDALSDLKGCSSVNVYSTHTHAGPDTLGLWGPTGVNGKNDAYMDALVRAAEEAAREAAANIHAGTLHYGKVETENMYRDSRIPEVYDPYLYQLRFAPADESKGLRLFFYGAHAESLRGDNRRLSRDFPGQLCDGVTKATGDRAMFFPGAIGGLIMTKAFVANTSTDALKNLEITSEKLINYALSITPESERELSPHLQLSREIFTVPLDNPAFQLYKFLGILNNKSVPGFESATGYGVESELNILMLDDLAVTLIPGELFPELALGGKYGDANPDGVNPRPLCEIAEDHGIHEMLIVGLANDELGYIVPPSDFLLNKKAPYLERTSDYKGEDHYEETNSVGPACAQAIADAFDAAAGKLN